MVEKIVKEGITKNEIYTQIVQKSMNYVKIEW
jgi:hypothetical protein